jgi:hypothetical protein
MGGIFEQLLLLLPSDVEISRELLPHQQLALLASLFLLGLGGFGWHAYLTLLLFLFNCNLNKLENGSHRVFIKRLLVHIDILLQCHVIHGFFFR